MNWEKRKFAEIVSKLQNGGTPSTKIPEFWEGNTPWITGADFANQKLAGIRRYVSKKAVQFSSTNVVSEGNLLLVTRTGVGKMAIAPFDVAISQDITGVNFASDISPEFMLFKLQHEIAYFLRLNQGTSINGITRNDLLDFEIKLPTSKTEQKRIAEILSTADEAIEQTAKLIDKYTRIKRGLMQDLLTGGIDERGNIRSKQTHKFTVKNGIEVPDDWDVVRLEEVAEIKRGKFTHRPRNEPRFYGGEFPFIQTGDISRCLGRTLNDFSQTLNEEGIKISKKFPKNTIVVTIAANIGDTAILGREMYLTDSVVGIIVKENQTPRFVEMWLRKNKEMLSSTAPQSAQKNINLETLKPLPIPLVSFDEQTKIVNAYEAELRIVEQLENNLTKLQAIKKGLMQDLLSGKKRVKIENEAS